MAHITSIWVHDDEQHKKKKISRVHVKLKPAGEVSLEWEMPASLYDAIVAMAQTQADAHEAKMHAGIIGDNTKEAIAVMNQYFDELLGIKEREHDHLEELKP